MGSDLGQHGQNTRHNLSAGGTFSIRLRNSCQYLGLGLKRIDVRIAPAAGTIDVNRLYFERLSAATQSTGFYTCQARVEVEAMF